MRTQQRVVTLHADRSAFDHQMERAMAALMRAAVSAVARQSVWAVVFNQNNRKPKGGRNGRR